MAAARAATTRLEPGQHSIDRAHPFEYRGGWALKWRVRLPSGKLVEKLTQAPTKGEARARARRKAEELLRTPGNAAWSPQSPSLGYLEQVTLPAIQSDRLAGTTQRRYQLAYRLLRGECGETHHHKHSLAGLSLYDAMRPRNLKDCLEEIGRLHGAKNVKHAKLVASKYLAGPLKIDGIIETNPLADLDIDLSGAKRPPVQRGGHALTLDEYRRVIAYLLAADPADVEKPKRGRWTVEDRIAERGALIDLVLTQAATGMRTSEIARRPVGDCDVDAAGNVVVRLPAAATKTRTGRPVPVLDPRVSARLIERMKGKDSTQPLFGAPTDPTKEWQPRNRDRKLAVLYEEIAAKCDVPMFAVERGHSWRTTLNSLLADSLPEDARIRLLGHTAEVNRQYYTAVTSTDAVIDAAAILRSPDTPQK